MKICFLSLLLVTCFSSCIQKRYLHNAPAVLNPMAREKGDVYAGVYYQSNGGSNNAQALHTAKTYSNGLNLQGAWAFSNHLGIAGGYSYVHQQQGYYGPYSEPFEESNVRYKRNEFTLAGNYILTDREKQRSLNLLFGTTVGTLKVTDAGLQAGANYSRYFHARTQSLFVQPAFNIFFPGTTSALGFSTRLGMQHYGDIRTDYTGEERARLWLDKTGWLFMAEAGLKVSVGIKPLPLALEMQGNYIYYHTSGIHVRRPNYSAGVAYRPGLGKKR